MAQRIRQDYVIGAKDKTARAIASAKRSFMSLDTVVRRALGTLATFAGVGGLGYMTKQTINAADKIGKLSIRLGISTQALSQYQHVAQQSGITFQSFTTALQRMIRRSSEAAQGSGPLKDALVELGISARSFAALKPDQQFERLATAFANIEEPADRVRLAMNVFDTEGVQMLQAMANGEEGIKQLRREADLLGLTLDRETTESAAAFNDAMGMIQTGLQGLANQIYQQVGPQLIKFVELLAYQIPVASHNVVVAFHGVRTAGLHMGAELFQVYGKWMNFLDTMTFSLVPNFEKAYRQALEDTITLSFEASAAAGHMADAIEDRLKFIKEWYDFLEHRQGTLFWEPSKNDPSDPYCQATKKIKKCLTEIDRVTQQVGSVFADAFADAIIEGGKLEDKLQDIGRALIRLAAQKLIADQIASGLSTIIGSFFPTPAAGTGTGTVTPVPAAAGGGTLRAGQMALVGEKGPEFFIPRTAGSVLPNGTGPGLNQTFTINAQGTDASMIPQLKQAVAEAARSGYQMVLADLQRGGPIRRTL